MFGMIAKVLAGPIIDKVGDLAGKFFGNKEAREANSAAVDKASIDQWAAESTKPNTNWFDSLVDGFNRLMRPIGFAITIWIVMIWPQYDLIGFQQAMVAYEAVPDWLAGLVITVWAFLYTGRFLSKDMTKFKSKSKKEFLDILEKQRDLEALRQSNKVPDNRVIPEVRGQYTPPSDSYAELHSQQDLTDAEYKKSMASHLPLSLPSIVEWNRRNNPTFQ